MNKLKNWFKKIVMVDEKNKPMFCVTKLEHYDSECPEKGIMIGFGIMLLFFGLLAALLSGQPELISSIKLWVKATVINFLIGG